MLIHVFSNTYFSQKSAGSIFCTIIKYSIRSIYFQNLHRTLVLDCKHVLLISYSKLSALGLTNYHFALHKLLWCSLMYILIKHYVNIYWLHSSLISFKKDFGLMTFNLCLAQDRPNHILHHYTVTTVLLLALYIVTQGAINLGPSQSIFLL